jgi:branched-chain amino acid transport system ATP-binding protein
VLEIRALHSAYGRIEVLHGVDLHVDAGEIVCLIGGNGAGKTTLMRAISGVQPISGGAIVFEGQDISKLAAEARVRLGIAQVPEGRQIFGGITVEDNLNLGGWLHGGGTAKERDDIYAMFPILHDKRGLAADEPPAPAAAR